MYKRQDNTLYLFEAPIDMLSFISLHKENWRSHSYAAACCVGDQVLFQMLKAHPNIDTVCLCMDNDAAGQAANKRISDIYDGGYGRDPWNEATKEKRYAEAYDALNSALKRCV